MHLIQLTGNSKERQAIVRIAHQILPRLEKAMGVKGEQLRDETSYLLGEKEYRFQTLLFKLESCGVRITDEVLQEILKIATNELFLMNFSLTPFARMTGVSIFSLQRLIGNIFQVDESAAWSQKLKKVYISDEELSKGATEFRRALSHELAHGLHGLNFPEHFALTDSENLPYSVILAYKEGVAQYHGRLVCRGDYGLTTEIKVDQFKDFLLEAHPCSIEMDLPTILRLRRGNTMLYRVIVSEYDSRLVHFPVFFEAGVVTVYNCKFEYAAGQRFFEYLSRHVGMSPFLFSASNPPRTMDEILDPQKYLYRLGNEP